MAQPIDFYFFVGSLHTYLAVMRIGEAIDAGIEERWRPFNLRAIMMEQNNIPARNVVKMKYIYRDVQRRAKRFGYPFEGVPKYPFDSDLLANRVAVIAAQQGWCREYLTAVYRSWMVEHGSPDTPEGLTPLLKALGKEPAIVLAAANSAATEAQLDATTEEARALGVFGAPTFAVGTEIFWGSDRFDDALDWAKSNGAT
ncbi:MAG: 2-hydroxychromene-2-carboxylate isomerase [Candidatus Eiseniibacteriota bacterium]